MTSLAQALGRRAVAIVGGSGLLGSHLQRQLLALRGADDAPIHCVSRTPPPEAQRLPGVTYWAASVLDDPAMAALPAAELAVYVAGATSNYLDDPLATVRLGSEGLQRFLDRYAAAERRLVVGSARIYGLRAEPTPLAEHDPCVVASPSSRNIYDATKLLGEALALAASRAAQPVVCARLGNVYGPYGARATATAFTQLVRQARRERRVTLTGAPASRRNHVAGADAADGLLRALLFGRGGESYNIGSDEHLSNLDFARAIAAALPFAVTVEAESRAAPDHLVLDLAKARQELAYHPSHHAADALGPAVRWELEQST